MRGLICRLTEEGYSATATSELNIVANSFAKSSSFVLPIAAYAFWHRLHVAFPYCSAHDCIVPGVTLRKSCLKKTCFCWSSVKTTQGSVIPLTFPIACAITFPERPGL